MAIVDRKDVILMDLEICNSICSSRMHFMLDIITSLRTNNPQKIPGYDPDKIENMRKLLRAQIKGVYASVCMFVCMYVLNS